MLREFENLCERPDGGLTAPEGIHLRAAGLLEGGVELTGWRKNEIPHWLCQTARLQRKSLSGGN